MAHNSVLVVMLMCAMVVVAFWRTVIKYVIMIAATTIIAALGYSAVMLWQSMHHVR